MPKFNNVSELSFVVFCKVVRSYYLPFILHMEPADAGGLVGSRDVDQLLVVIRVALHEATLDQVLNAFLDHLHIGLEEADILDDATDQLVDGSCLQGLHVAHGNGVDDVLSLDGDILVDGAHDTRFRLVLQHLLGGELRDEVILEGLALKAHVDENFFVRIVEVGLTARVLHDASLRLAEVGL